jgi:ribosome-binding protein aMBF1 (putative translation factor)
MTKLKFYDYSIDLKNRLKDPEFKKAWQASEPEFLLAKQMIEKRQVAKLSQRDLAKKLNTSQAAISRLESMRGNPSLSFLKRLSHALGSPLTLSI